MERTTKRIFLKRIRIPTVKLEDLVPGGAITIYSRQLTVIDAANDYTKQLIRKQASTALFVIAPKGYVRMGEIIKVLEQSGLAIVNTVMAQLQRHHVKALSPHILKESSSLCEDEYLRDVSVLVEVKLPTSSLFEEALGKLEAARLREFVLVGEIGLDIFRPSSSIASKQAATPATSSLFPSTAVFDNCSLCLLKPRMLRERRVGDVLDAILQAGFEISALKLVHLQMSDADEFFRVYKGIFRQYHVSDSGRCELGM